MTTNNLLTATSRYEQYGEKSQLTFTVNKNGLLQQARGCIHLKGNEKDKIEFTAVKNGKDEVYTGRTLSYEFTAGDGGLVVSDIVNNRILSFLSNSEEAKKDAEITKALINEAELPPVLYITEEDESGESKLEPHLSEGNKRLLGRKAVALNSNGGASNAFVVTVCVASKRSQGAQLSFRKFFIPMMVKDAKYPGGEAFFAEISPHHCLTKPDIPFSDNEMRNVAYILEQSVGECYRLSKDQIDQQQQQQQQAELQRIQTERQLEVLRRERERLTQVEQELLASRQQVGNTQSQYHPESTPALVRTSSHSSSSSHLSSSSMSSPASQPPELPTTPTSQAPLAPNTPVSQPPLAPNPPASLPPLVPNPPASLPPLVPNPPASQPPLAPNPPASLPPLAPNPPASLPPLAPNPPASQAPMEGKKVEWKQDQKQKAQAALVLSELVSNEKTLNKTPQDIMDLNALKLSQKPGDRIKYILTTPHVTKFVYSELLSYRKELNRSKGESTSSDEAQRIVEQLEIVKKQLDNSDWTMDKGLIVEKIKPLTGTQPQAGTLPRQTRERPQSAAPSRQYNTLPRPAGGNNVKDLMSKFEQKKETT
ncbi:hypothetical protein D5018_20210 [Parashewanella curva]|uniref:Uncharacterized protein n=1 Tax=Parashewanella curva TaxID=2338552 RepID=A0A3L8PV16_9GAMM|nr:hypothetical protein [Parashewanella curva]RLV57882.1 hypothetical protein D5018_20210 [Parashewanella curva]